MLHIQQLLESLLPLKVENTGFRSRTFRDDTIKIVLFDIYGTLLISDSGDVDRMSVTTDNFRKALEYAGIDSDKWEQCNSEPAFNQVIKQMIGHIRQEHAEKRAQGIPYPEVEILKIWEMVFSSFQCPESLKKEVMENTVEIALAFELLSNRVFPMPGMQEVIQSLISAGFPLGIVSNAQFYTPAIMNYFLTGELLLKDEIKGFQPDLTVFSYLEFIAKPDKSLFEKVIAVAREKYNAAPAEILFVGNDMHKDVWAANQTGIKTVLFAGDTRSLRLHTDKPEVVALKPDFVITDLKQLFNIIQI